ncbi:pyroglutamyl peptidase [Streptomyces sp. AK02-01A]|uniref:pyroglutamyl peptidase n=1 Tax=Streptomyces sp. AK02-01A TaxID=3028648 RepID=UPI0029A4BD86|nr:pyroglutamyl peptidase [Streptomyces sp. AK02-01A]MDX3849693.1 pyroglutamyl peptidase [Streptomyces sp. AK02-01A]MDX3849737.1 pyroglutamyl peptidase [Streptomyces sp. AK02-01A]
MSRIRVRPDLLGVVLLTSAALTLAVPPPSAAAQQAPASASFTVEEQRLDGAVPREILRRSGFDEVAPDFVRALRGADSYAEAERAVARQGTRLWQRAVDRAQGRGPARGDLSRDDDRPLYWARLALTRELRQWQPEFRLSEAARTRLLGTLERSSRGQDSLTFPARKGGHDRGVKRIVVTGFDPFTLDSDIRISNPSGATALALDGTVIRTADGPARIETAVFPVRWQDFADGTVERALRGPLSEADLFTTVSQGRVGRIDVERFNGAWRGGFGDNENVSETGLVPVTDPASQPQWTTTSLPYQAIVAADTGRFPVYDNTSVTEIPAGATAPVVRPDGPTAGSAARAGGGGDYLSNEIAYRATLLRDRLGRDIPGGHVHTPVLQFGAGNTDPATGTVTDPEFVQNRLDIIEQLRTIIKVAAEAS